MPHRQLAWLEYTLLFFGVPLLLSRPWGRALPQAPEILLLAVAAPCTVWLRWRRRREGGFWRGDRSAEQRELRRLLRRFGLAGFGIVALVLVAWPARLFDLPAERPGLWALVLLTYPLSVWLQEVVFRAYFFARFRTIFPHRRRMILASAAAFGWVHLPYGNGVAITLAFAGGLFFAATYARSRSLRLVFLEHTLYGSLIFTVGLGGFFLLHGAP